MPHPAKETRQQKRARQREEAKRARTEEQQAEAQAAQQQAFATKAQQASDLGTYINGFRSGYLDGYFQALADLKGGNVIKIVASQILAVNHDPEEQAKYVLDKFQRAMRPRNLEALEEGLGKAVAKHLTDQGIMPPVPDAEEEAPKVEVDEEGRTPGGLVIPGASS